MSCDRDLSKAKEDNTKIGGHDLGFTTLDILVSLCVPLCVWIGKWTGYWQLTHYVFSMYSWCHILSEASAQYQSGGSCQILGFDRPAMACIFLPCCHRCQKKKGERYTYEYAQDFWAIRYCTVIRPVGLFDIPWTAHLVMPWQSSQHRQLRQVQ